MKCFLLLAFLTACNPDAWGTPTVTATYPNPLDGGLILDAGVIPFVNGGTFVTALSVPLPGLQGPAHALLQIVSDQAPPGAVTSASVVLSSTDGGPYIGAATLTWPIGGIVPLQVQLAGVNTSLNPPQMQVPALHVFIPDQFDDGGLNPAQTGTQDLYAVCIQSTTENGAVAVHLENAVVSGGTADLSGALALGDCPGLPADGGFAPVNSHLYFVAVPLAPLGGGPPATVSSFRVTATLAGTQLLVIDQAVKGVLPIPGPPPVTLCLSSDAGAPAAAGTLVEVDVAASVSADGGTVECDAGVLTGPAKPAAGLTVQLQSTSPVSQTPFDPATLVTDVHGQGATHFVMPNSRIRVDATAGSARTSITF